MKAIETKTKLDWENDKRLKHWLENRKKNTVGSYRKAFKRYVQFRELTPEELIIEKWEDMKKPPYEQGVVEDNLKAFNKWLIEEKKYAPRSALTICGAICDFYRRHNMPISLKITQEFAGATKGVNETEKMRAEQIEKLAYYAPTLRDKAIIWCMFQGGMDVSTVCSLNWGHIEKEIANPPMGAVMLRGLVRKKEPSQKFITLIYKTAVKHLVAYLKSEYGEYAVKLKHDTPLFLSRSREGRYSPRWIQKMLKDIAPDAGIAGSRLSEADINPLRPHALRASFGDQISKAGASPELKDFLMGHKLKFDTAYFGGEEGLREAYVRYAELVLEPKRTKPLEEIENVLREEIETLKERDKQHIELNRLLKAEVEELRKRMTRYESFTRRFMEMSPDELEEVGKAVEKKRQARIIQEHEEAHKQEEPFEG